jgi:hypothetical protein
MFGLVGFEFTTSIFLLVVIKFLPVGIAGSPLAGGVYAIAFSRGFIFEEMGFLVVFLPSLVRHCRICVF